MTLKSEAAPTPGQIAAEKWLRQHPGEEMRPVEEGDLDRLTDTHLPDERDRDFGVATTGGGEGGVGNTYPASGHYRRQFNPHEDASTPRGEDPPIWDRTNWDSILGQAGFQFKAHPDPTVNGFYWRPDQPENASSLGYRIEHPSSWEPYWKAHYGQSYRDGGSAIAMSQSLHNVIGAVAEHNSRAQWQSRYGAVPDTWEVAAAAKKPAPKKPRKPEEVWYDVHKHPAGVPGGMGLSPEHHLRNRGWNGHEINEGSGKKTIQYRNHKYPDFVISYGGGSGTKPDHNFRVLHMGTNPHVPKVTRAYSVAEAMNKVEELHGLNSGLIVQPMTHDSAVAQLPDPDDIPDVPKTPAAPVRDMDVADNYPDFPSQPTHTERWRNPNRNYQLHQIPEPPKIKPPKPVSYTADVRGVASALRMAEQDTWEES